MGGVLFPILSFLSFFLSVFAGDKMPQVTPLE